MLLVEFTVNGAMHRISTELHTLEHPYLERITSMGQIRYAAPTPYGGMVSPSYGSISIVQSFFEGNWPPPVTCPVKIKLGTVDEATAETIMDGTAHMKAIGDDDVTYDLYGPFFDDEVTDATYNDTLVNIFSAAATTLGLTLDSSAARSPSPAVKYTVSGDNEIISNLDTIARFFSHFFVIVGTTMHLIDAKADNGTKTLTDYDIYPSDYTRLAPYRRIESGDYSVSTGYAHSDKTLTITPCHDTQSNIIAALTDIKNIINAPRIEFRKPVSDIPAIGERITVTDNSMFEPVTAWGRVSGMVFDFMGEQCVLTGAGGIS